MGRTVQGFSAVTSCSNEFDENGNQKVLNSTNVRSACGGGGEPDENGSVAYECVNRAPFDKDDQRYGFVAANGKVGLFPPSDRSINGALTRFLMYWIGFSAASATSSLFLTSRWTARATCAKAAASTRASSPGPP